MSSRGFLRFEMDSSRRAVESYWRLRLIDTATSDEDKVTPVYKLEEICELLRSSHVGIVKEISEFVMKRLDHKSPIVKQKALRLIKYVVGKSGADFRREMQRNSVAVRNLVHYKGQPDPLKGDALNKAVRATAQEAVSAIFSEETSKPTVAPDLNKRIEGFGNTNFEMPSEGKKSFLSEVVGLGSASIKQGINTFAQGHMSKKNENGSFKSPNLHRSLTMENDSSSSYEPVKLQTQGSFGISKNVESGSWGQNSGVPSQHSTSGHVQAKTREEKLVETIVTSGGVRLQPTRDSLQVFLLEAAKLDAVALSLALEAKLQSPMWQIRMKAICVLEAILRKKDDEPFFVVASYYSENRDAVVSCSESPQSSLREKANRVLTLLNGGQSSGLVGSMGKQQAVVELPDLIDTGGPDFIADDSSKKPIDLNVTNHTAVTPPLIDDLFGDSISMSAGPSTTEQKNDDDPFADVSFHPGEEKEPGDDLFSGMTVGEKPVADSNHVSADTNQPEFFDMFGPTSQPKAEMQNPKDVNDLMASFSIDENSSEKAPSSITHENIFAVPATNSNHQSPDSTLSGILGSQTPGLIPNPMFPVGAMPYNLAPGIMLNPAFASQPFNYAAMGNLLAQQQQFLSSMSNFQQFGYGHMNTQGSLSGDTSGTYAGSPLTLPDIFQSNISNQAPASVMNSSKKEDTRAFDFISDHLAAARDPKRIS